MVEVEWPRQDWDSIESTALAWLIWSWCRNIIQSFKGLAQALLKLTGMILLRFKNSEFLNMSISEFLDKSF